MKLSRKSIRETARRARQIVFPKALASTPESAAAWADAAALWRGLFAPFQPLVSGANVLELGCGDGRVLGGLAEAGETRNLVGVDRVAYWDGKGDGVAWAHRRFRHDLSLNTGVAHLQTLAPASFDLVLCRELDSALSIDQLDQGLVDLYRLTKPGGEAILRMRCADPGSPRREGPGYGFMTASAWIHMIQRVGFEVEDSRRAWRDGHATGQSLDLETAEMHLHLVRPWEPNEVKKIVG